MKKRKGSVAVHSWDLHEYLYITGKHRRARDCDVVSSSGCYNQVLMSILDNMERTICLGGNLIIKGIEFC